MSGEIGGDLGRGCGDRASPRLEVDEVAEVGALGIAGQSRRDVGLDVLGVGAVNCTRNRDPFEPGAGA